MENRSQKKWDPLSPLILENTKSDSNSVCQLAKQKQALAETVYFFIYLPQQIYNC